MTRTENLNLPQWEAEDYVQRSDFNDAFASLDEGYSTAMAAAEQVTASLGGKADVATVEAAVEALAAQHSSDVAKLGSCQVVLGSYTGTGKYAGSNPNTLTFEHRPLFLAVGGDDATYQYAFFRNCSCALCGNSNLSVTWGDNTVKWISTSNAAGQCNTKNSTYYYLALVDMSV
jgi:hypothetical protein